MIKQLKTYLFTCDHCGKTHQHNDARNDNLPEGWKVISRYRKILDDEYGTTWIDKAEWCDDCVKEYLP